MNKKLTLFLILFILVFTVFPKQITFNKANIIAENWTQILEEKFADQVRVKDAHTIYKKGNIVAYVFEFYPKGFMIVSAEDYFSPVKFYSLKYDYQSSTKPLEELIFDRYHNIIDLVKKGKISLNREIVERNRAVFKRLTGRDLKYSTYKGFNDKTEDVTEEVKPNSLMYINILAVSLQENTGLCNIDNDLISLSFSSMLARILSIL